MKLIPDSVAQAMPEVVERFSEWVEAFRAMQAALDQDAPDVEVRELMKTHREKMDAYSVALNARLKRWS